jgi:hypothetical protein
MQAFLFTVYIIAVELEAQARSHNGAFTWQELKEELKEELKSQGEVSCEYE